MSEYSNTGPINVWYIMCKAFRSSINFNLRITFILPDRLFVIKSIWSSYVSSSENTNLRCLWLSTSYIVWLFMANTGCLAIDLYLDISIDSVLEGLKVTSHWVAHLYMLGKSAWCFWAALTVVSTMILRIVSSVNKRTKASISTTTSLM